MSEVSTDDFLFFYKPPYFKRHSNMQSYYEITSNGYLAFIRKYVTGIGPWKDTIVPPEHEHLGPPTDLVARAHALNLQVSCLR